MSFIVLFARRNPLGFQCCFFFSVVFFLPRTPSVCFILLTPSLLSCSFHPLSPVICVSPTLTHPRLPFFLCPLSPLPVLYVSLCVSPVWMREMFVHLWAGYLRCSLNSVTNLHLHAKWVVTSTVSQTQVVLSARLLTKNCIKCWSQSRLEI